MKRLIILVLLGLICGSGVFAQTSRHPWAVTGRIGLGEYSGNLGNNFFTFYVIPEKFYGPDRTLIQKNQPGMAGASVGRYLNPHFNVTLHYLHGEWGYHSPDKTVFFYRAINSVDLELKYKFLGRRSGFFTPYVLTGIGYWGVKIPPPTKVSTQNMFYLPLGIGFDLNLTEHIQLNIQSNIGILNGRTLNIGGNGTDGMDILLNHCMGLTYLFGNSVRESIRSSRLGCPKL